MKRIAGLAALLALAAAGCSESPTAPADTGTRLRVGDQPMSVQAKLDWYKSQGIDLRQPPGSTTGLQSLIAPPPFFVFPFGTDLHEGDDDCRFVNLGFVFTFFGRQYTGVWVNSNGNLTFDSCFTQFSATFIPGGSGNHSIIAPLWSDWYSTDGGGSGSVNVQLLGIPPLRRLVATWSGIAEFPGFGSNTFQVQILEFLGTIVMSYNGLTASGFHGSTAMTAGISSGPFSGFGAGYGGLRATKLVAVGAQVPALYGHTICLVNLGSGYQQYDNICSLFVH